MAVVTSTPLHVSATRFDHSSASDSTPTDESWVNAISDNKSYLDRLTNTTMTDIIAQLNSSQIIRRHAEPAGRSLARSEGGWNYLKVARPPPTAPARSIMPVQQIRHNAEVVAMTSADKYCPPWSCEYGVVIDF